MFSGSLVAIVTPFSTKGKKSVVDEKKLRELIEFQIK
ncbi:MAG: dihydrodipicolinate synthase family protein, partial [Candidatus Omnitrophota bacterium]